jgi:hypothetical protein
VFAEKIAPGASSRLEAKSPVVAALATGNTLVDPVIAVRAAAWATPSYLHIDHAKFPKPRLGQRLPSTAAGFGSPARGRWSRVGR